MLPVDHLMMGVGDFGASEDWWRSERGLASVDGIEFEGQPGWGNRGVPLGDIWIELVGIVDREALREDPRANMFSQIVGDGHRLLGWALAPDDLEAVATRLGLPIVTQRATNPQTRQAYSWRQVGFEETRMEPYLPFFVGWEHPMHDEARRWTQEVGNPAVSATDVRMELAGDPGLLAQWLGDIETQCSIVEGPPSLTAHLNSGTGDITVR